MINLSRDVDDFLLYENDLADVAPVESDSDLFNGEARFVDNSSDEDIGLYWSLYTCDKST